MSEEEKKFVPYLRAGAVDWSNPESKYYSWPLIEETPEDVVKAYTDYVKRKSKAKENGTIID